MKEAVAIHKGARLSAQKARLVVNEIRNRPVVEALRFLTLSPKKGADIVQKLLNSAIANSEQLHPEIDISRLRVSTVFANEAAVMKRMRARAKGRSNRILKRSCHITVKISEGLRG